MLIISIMVFVLLCLLFTCALCKVAARADRQSERTYAALQAKRKPHPPGLCLDSGEFIPAEELNRHPSVARAMGRAA